MSDPEQPALNVVAELDLNQIPGDDAYDILRPVFGPKSAETDDANREKCEHDQYVARRHHDFTHVRVDSDQEVGRHFLILLHRDLDGDSAGCKNDRQRCEIKVYDKSPTKLQAHERDTFLYEWKFRPDPDITFSENFTHLFQLKPKGESNSKFPLLTITGKLVDGTSELQLVYRPNDVDEDHGELLAHVDWSTARGVWLTASCRVKHHRSEGSLDVCVTRPDGSLVLGAKRDVLATWREGNELIRPKWGLYRSLKHFQTLRPEEESIRLASLKISRSPVIAG